MQIDVEGNARKPLAPVKKKKKPVPPQSAGAPPQKPDNPYLHNKTALRQGYRSPELAQFQMEQNDQELVRYEREKAAGSVDSYNPPSFTPSKTSEEAIARATAIGYRGLRGSDKLIKNPMLLDVLTQTVQEAPTQVQKWVKDHGIQIFLRGVSKANLEDRISGSTSDEYAGYYVGTRAQELGILATPVDWIWKGGNIIINVDMKDLKSKESIAPYLRDTLFHEIGHALDYSTNPPERLKHVGKATSGTVANRLDELPSFSRARKAPYAMEGYDEYYTKSASESFAETFSRYMSSKASRAELDPGIRAFLDRIVGPTLPQGGGRRAPSQSKDYVVPSLKQVAFRLFALKQLVSMKPIEVIAGVDIRAALLDADSKYKSKFSGNTLPGATLRAAERTRDEASGELQRRYLKKLGY